MLLSLLWYLSTQGWKWNPSPEIQHYRPKGKGKRFTRSVGANKKQGIKTERLGRQEAHFHKDSNENQLDCQGDPGVGELKLSLDGSLSQADPSDYHWCEEEDLSETVDSSSCADQETTSRSLPSGTETNDPHYVALAQKIDSHLAHIDMEEFKSEDMHSLLLDAADPCKAAVLSTKQTCETSYSQDDCSLTDGSLCKSGPLFSPQRAVNHPEFSTDSLNSDDKEEWLEEAEREARNLLLAVDCKTNVTNYTLAWSSGTDGDYNEPGSSSSGSDHSHWSSSGGGCGIRTVSRYAPPIPPWPSRPGVSCATWPRVDRTINAVPTYPIVHNLQTLQGSPLKKGAIVKGRVNQLNNSNQLCSQSTKKSCDNVDNTQPLDADNGNEELGSKDGRSAEKAKDRADESNTNTEGLSLLQIYMRQKSGSALKSPRVDESDVIASGGGEGWVEDYPSSVDGKLSSDSETSCSSNDNKGARSMTLTDASDIEQSSLQIDAQPFNCSHKLNTSCGTASSLDKLIAKIKPFEIGLSPGSIEEHWNFHIAPKKDEKGCQTLPASSNDKATITEPSASPNVYVIFPSYSMPDLSFLRKSQYQWIDNTLFSPQDFSPTAKISNEKEILRNVDEILQKDLSHIKDWDSLNVLLPKEIREAVHGHYVPRNKTAPKQQRPKSCDAGVLLREQKTQRSQRSSGYRGSSTITWTESGGFALPTVPQSPPSPHSPCGEIPPPLPKRTASLPANREAAAAAKPETEPSQQKRPTIAKIRQHELSHAVVNKPKTLSLPKQSTEYEDRTELTPNMRKTVSFGEHLCNGLSSSKNKSKSRPLSVSNMEVDYDVADADEVHKDPACNVDRMKGLVQEASVAAAQLCRLMHQSLINDEDEDSSLLMKHISRTITGKLSPALYEILSDGLLPSVNTFFGHVTNSVWRVVEASVKKAPTLPWIEELVFCLNNEESLPEGPVRFGVFVAELVNMGAVDWWLDNLACKEAIIRRHYSPGGFLYLCHTSTRALMQDLKTALKPLAALPLDCSIPWSAEVPWKSKTTKTTPQKTTPTKTTPTKTSPTVNTPTKTTPTKTTPTRGNARMQRPLSCVESPSRSAAAAAAKAGYRRAQSQQQMTGAVVTEKAEPFSSLKKKWENLSSQKKSEATLNKKAEQNVNPSPVRSRIPRPVSRVLK